MASEPTTDIVVRGDRLGEIEASLDNFTAAEKLDLSERLARSIQSNPADEAEAVRCQRESLDRLMAEMEALPCSPNPDGFSGRDHDKILYGSVPRTSIKPGLSICTLRIRPGASPTA